MEFLPNDAKNILPTASLTEDIRARVKKQRLYVLIGTER